MNLYETGIRPLIDEYIQKKREEKRDYGEYWSASSGGYCMRKVIFERLGVPPVSEDPRKQRVFEAGHVFHRWLQDITKDAGLSIAQELELQDEELKIRGHIDDLVLVDGRLILYDLKTAHSKWFEYAKGRPMSHYNRHQIGTYMYMLRNFKSDAPNNSLRDKYRVNEVAEARRLAISKDDLRLFEQQLLWSPDLEKEVVGYWTTLNGYWKKKTIPRCTCADYEKNSKTDVGFMANPKYNPYFFEGEPCSIKWYELNKDKLTKKEVK